MAATRDARRKALKIAIAAIDGADDELYIYLSDDVSQEEKEAVSQQLQNVKQVLSEALYRSFKKPKLEGGK
jgi:hypothetical protein